MHNLESIMNLLNGPHGPAIFAGLRRGFFVCLALAVLALLFAARPPAKGHFRLLAFGFWLTLLAVLGYQASWQLAGFRQPEFVRFMRFHDPRPEAAVRQIQRGQITDWRGTVLARSLSSDPWQRIYPMGPAVCHVVGYVNPIYGMSGVERVADATLCGYSFANLTDLDRFGRNLLNHRVASGSDVRLTIDAELQYCAYKLMNGKRGAVVVLRPKDGAVLCLVSVPAFDPADPGAALADTTGTPLLNRATQGRYPPGSTFKILIAGLAAEQKIAPQFFCSGDGYVPAPGEKPIRDSEYYAYLREGRDWQGHGRIGLTQAFAHSSNVYFSQLGVELGAMPLNDLAERSLITMHLPYYDGPTGALKSEAGTMPVIGPKAREAMAQTAIGQGDVLVTPLHMAVWTAAVADEGMMWRPRLRDTEAPIQLGRLMSPTAAETVKGLMRETVLHGTGRPANIKGLNVCGKTGTAEAPSGDDHAWFTCFAPAAKPEIVVTVIVENGGYGSKAAAPIARAVLEEAVELGLVGTDARENVPAQ